MKDQSSNEQLVSRLNETKKEIYCLTYHNPITNLPNRKKFDEIFEEKIRQQNCSEAAVLSIDIDRFHSINELYGRDTGDQLLLLVAERLRNLFECDHCVFHDNKDTFLVYSEGTTYEDTEQLGLDIFEVLSELFTIDGRSFYITASVGGSHYPTTGKTSHDLLNQAEIAMFKVKKCTQNSYITFLPQDAKDIERKVKIELELQKAIENEELFLMFQPKIELKTDKVISVEALLRWNHPELGVIPPNEFIPIAEETGIIIDIGYWVIYEAVKQTRVWHDLGYKVRIAINVSAMQFWDRHFVMKLSDMLTTFKIDAKYLEVEITESVFKDYCHSDSVVEKLKRLGARIAIDDFGTGYSSLSILKDTIIDTVKMDKSFIDNIPKDPISSILVATMIRMGEDLGFSLIAEGIETQEQADYLIEHGCFLGQGFLYSKPVLAPELTEYMERNGLAI